ncbi:hypothetical protein D3C71_1802210 [compost metagenome]
MRITSASEGWLPIAARMIAFGEACCSHCRSRRFGSEPSERRPIRPLRMTCTKVRSMRPLSITCGKAAAKASPSRTLSIANSSAGTSFICATPWA